MPKLEISKVHDAYAAGGECPLCALICGAERSYLSSFQGSRVMEPTVRVKTNESGFCTAHYKRLYRGENKLGLGLVLHTHLQTWLPRLRAGLAEASAPEEKTRKRRKDGDGPLDGLMEILGGLRDSCFICSMLDMDLDRYIETILYLRKEDGGFRETLLASRGFCLEHFRAVVSKARTGLRGQDLSRFMEDLAPIMIRSLEGLERDLLNFTQLFQDANRSLGTEEERTALLRTVQKLAGCAIGPE